MRIKRKKKISILTLLTSAIIFLLLVSTFIYYNYEFKKNGKNNIEKITLSRDSNLRTGPAEQYPKLTLLGSGQEVEKISSINEWIEVKTANEEVGWIAGWDVVGSGIRSPEDGFYEKLKNFKVLINPIFNNKNSDYTLLYAKEIKKSLEKNKISVDVTRLESIDVDRNFISTKVNDYNPDVIINLMIVNNNKSIGPEIYYSNYQSQVFGKYIERKLSNNYVSKVRIFEKNELYSNPIKENTPEITVSLGNVSNIVDEDILNNTTFRNMYFNSIEQGVKNYFYYLLTIEDQNNKRKQQLLNMPQKGINVPFFYTKQEDFKDIPYGNDNKKISDNGDAIVSLYMLSRYFEPNLNLSLVNIVEWAGNTYYSKQGTSELIFPAFAKKYGYSIDVINDDYLKNINDSLKENRPVLVKFRKGIFGETQSYKIIRGEEDGRYYINDPDDDEVKLNNYTGFSSSDIEKNIIKAWVFNK